MKKCKKCKADLKKGTTFCPECGSKIKRGPWKWIFSIIIILFIIGGGIALFYSNNEKHHDKKNEPSVESQEQSISSSQEISTGNEQETKKVDQFERMMTDDENLMDVAIAWYGNEVLDNNHWLAWQKEVYHTKPSEIDDSVHNTEKGDGVYHCYTISNKSNITQGYVLSKDKKTVYLYSRLSVGSEEKPEATVSLNKIAKAIIEKHQSERLIKLSKEKSASNKDLELGSKQVALHDYMDEWQKVMNQEYEEDPLDIDDGNYIEMQDVTITNKAVDHEDALLSINGKFVDLSLDKPSKQGYQVIAAYSGVSDNAKKYRYLFVMHNGKPEVLVAHMPEAVGDTDRGPAVNFVPTQNAALPSAFKQIMETGKAPKVPEKQENVINKSDKDLIIDYLLSQYDSDNIPPREFYIISESSYGDGSYFVQENHKCDWAEQEGLDPNVDPGVGVYKVIDGEVKKVEQS